MPFQGHRVVAVTPAGRKCYLELLVPQLLRYAADGLLDEYQLWVNTTNADDIAYMEALAAAHPHVIRLRRLPPDVPHNGSLSIHWFFRECIEDGTVYVRFDDDIVLLDDANSFRRFLDFRIRHPEYFLVYASILNNAVNAHILQRLGKLDIPAGGKVAGYACMDAVGWNDGDFAARVHDQVLAAAGACGNLRKFRHDGEWKLFYYGERVSINCIAWLGREFRALCGGVVGLDEEHELSVKMPQQLRRMNTVYGGYCVVHYGFYTQRARLNELGYYERYAALLSDIAAGTCPAR
jgi:hypothetical protein